jgi:DNA topoisomerase IA
LIIEREKEIQNFKPEESWKIVVQLTFIDEKGTKSQFESTLNKVDGKVKKFTSKEDALKLFSVLFDDISQIKEEKNKK